MNCENKYLKYYLLKIPKLIVFLIDTCNAMKIYEKLYKIDKTLFRIGKIEKK